MPLADPYIFQFYKNRIGDDVIVTSKQCMVNISISTEATNFILGTNTQQYLVHPIVRVHVTLTDAEDQRLHKNKQMVISRKVLHTQTSNLVTRYNTISNIYWHTFSWPWRHSRSQRPQTWRCLRSLNASFYYNAVINIRMDTSNIACNKCCSVSGK